MTVEARPPRIATVGFQGFGNIGDEAILTGIERLLEGTRATVVTVFSGPETGSVAAFPGVPRLVTWKHLPTLRALRVLRRVDRLILAGGGLFNDHWTAVIPRYLAWTLAGRLAGARVAWVGVGVGPVRRGWLRAVLRLGARIADVVTVRDRGSARVLGASVGSVVVPDPSVFNEIPGRRQGDGIGIVVRAPAPSQREHGPRLLHALAELVRHLADRGQSVRVLSMGGPADADFVAQLQSALAGRDGVSVAALGPAPDDALRMLAGLESVVTLRLHGLLLAALAGVPVVAVAYDPKVDAAAERLGLADLVISLDAVSAERVLTALDTAGEDARRQVVAAAVRDLRADRTALISAIAGAEGRA
jgi:polysaccharide pyruvyl transferase WcaK-like protein